MEIVITGGSGFIGTHLLENLINDNRVSKIHVIDIQTPKLSSNKIIFYNCNIREKINITIDADNVTCYHLAALAKEPGFAWEEYYYTNYLGTKNVIEFCENNNIKTIIFTSTMMVYKAKEYQFCEDDLTTPDTAYGISKLLAEEALLAWKKSNIANKLLIYRVAVVFGKGENGNYTRLYNAIKKGFFFYIGKKTTVKSSIYVKDVVKALLFPLERQMKYIIYNLCFPQRLEIKDIVTTIKKVFNIKTINFTIPYWFALLLSYPFEILNVLGIKNGIHHRRIQKLFFSTDITCKKLLNEGFVFDYNIESAIEDWEKECNNEGLF